MTRPKFYSDFVNEWGEPFLEAKNVGTLYHMTSLEYLIGMGTKHFVFHSFRKTSPSSPYPDSYFISLTRNPRLQFQDEPSELDNGKVFSSNVRIVVDGNKLSEKHKVFPFSDLEVSPEDRGSKKSGESEEVVLIPGGADKINLKPFITRVDIYENPDIPNYNEKYLSAAIEGLKQNSIPYKMVPKFYS